MTDSIGVAVLAGLGGMAGWGLGDFFAKKTIDEVGDVTTLFWSQLLGIVPLLLLFAVGRDVPELHGYDPLWLVLLGAGSALAYVVLYTGFGKGAISVLSPVLASEAAFTVLFSVVFFGEHVTGRQWVAIGVVLIGVVAISTSLRDFRMALQGSAATRGLSEVFVGAVAFGFWIALLDRFLGDRSWVVFLIVIRACAALTVAVYSRITGASLRLPRALYWQAALVGVADTAAFASVSYGLSATTHTSIIAVLSATFSLPTIILARIFLGERLVLSQKFAAAIILTGVALVSLP